MILADLRHYLQQRGQASLADMALHFDTTPDALRGMLDLWVRKGRVRRQSASSACGTGCCKCDPATVDIYCWTAGVGYAGDAPKPTPADEPAGQITVDCPIRSS